MKHGRRSTHVLHRRFSRSVAHQGSARVPTRPWFFTVEDSALIQTMWHCPSMALLSLPTALFLKKCISPSTCISLLLPLLNFHLPLAYNDQMIVPIRNEMLLLCLVLLLVI